MFAASACDDRAGDAGGGVVDPYVEDDPVLGVDRTAGGWLAAGAGSDGGIPAVRHEQRALAVEGEVERPFRGTSSLALSCGLGKRRASVPSGRRIDSCFLENRTTYKSPEVPKAIPPALSVSVLRQPMGATEGVELQGLTTRSL